MKKEVNKTKKPFYKKWWFWVIVVIILAGAFGDSDSSSSNSSKKNSSYSSAQSSKVVKKETTDQLQKIKAENLKIGTSKEQVIKKLGKPVDNSDRLLTYHGFNLYFENNKLVGGIYQNCKRKLKRQLANESKEKKINNSRFKTLHKVSGKNLWKKYKRKQWFTLLKELEIT